MIFFAFWFFFSPPLTVFRSFQARTHINRMGSMMHVSSGKADYELYSGANGPVAQTQKFYTQGYLSSREVILKCLYVGNSVPTDLDCLSNVVFRSDAVLDGTNAFFTMRLGKSLTSYEKVKVGMVGTHGTPLKVMVDALPEKKPCLCVFEKDASRMSLFSHVSLPLFD